MLDGLSLRMVPLKDFTCESSISNAKDIWKLVNIKLTCIMILMDVLMFFFQKPLTTRTDDFSFQVTSAKSRLFFVRIDTAKSSKGTLIFSDFKIVLKDEDIAFSALSLIEDQFGPLENFETLKFLNILPVAKVFSEKDACNEELCLRHDTTVSVVKRYGRKSGFAVADAFLSLRDGKFDTIIRVGR